MTYRSAEDKESMVIAFVVIECFLEHADHLCTAVIVVNGLGPTAIKGTRSGCCWWRHASVKLRSVGLV